MRSAVVGLLAACGLGLTLFLGWSWPASLATTAAEAPAWQLRQLVFLKAAYDRMQADLARPSDASASLEAERDRIVRQIAETAKLLPADAVPPDIGGLLAAFAAPAAPAPAPATPTAAGAQPQQPASLTDLIAAVAGEAEDVPDLRVGLAKPPPSALGDATIAIDPGLRQPLVLQSGRKAAHRKALAQAPADAGKPQADAGGKQR